MRKIRDVSEDEMIAIYLQTELSSIRFSQKLELHMEEQKIDTHIIQEPDWLNAAENVLRRTLLGVYRGYGLNTDYFPDFPAHVRWGLVGLSREEMERVRYIDWEYWLELTDGTRMAIDGAQCAGGKSDLRCEQRWIRVHGSCAATRGTIPATYLGGEGRWSASRRHGRTCTIDCLSHCA